MKVLRKQEIETANIQVGDQVIIPLAEIGEFSATAHKVSRIMRPENIVPRFELSCYRILEED